MCTFIYTVCVSETALLSFYGSLVVLSRFFLNLRSFVLLLDPCESFHEDSWRVGYKLCYNANQEILGLPMLYCHPYSYCISFLSGKQM
jgi:hypothetical protein